MLTWYAFQSHTDAHRVSYSNPLKVKSMLLLTFADVMSQTHLVSLTCNCFCGSAVIKTNTYRYLEVLFIPALSSTSVKTHAHIPPPSPLYHPLTQSRADGPPKENKLELYKKDRNFSSQKTMESPCCLAMLLDLQGDKALVLKGPGAK